MSAEKHGVDSYQSAKEFFAGCLGGISQVFIGQPFDIMKVRLVTSNQYKGMGDAFRQILSQEGPLAFYKGSVAPLIGVGAAVSIQFGVVEKTKRFFQNLIGAGELPLKYVFVSGAVAGLANSIVSISAEHIRIRLQTQRTGAGIVPEYSGSIDAIQKIFKNHGIAGIYKGTCITVYRAVSYTHLTLPTIYSV
eukprot:TRINITY_DN10350_c0_g3_i2.p1 TRINITY_DN10350_c0_g3~~TRINITY_DN10350_c0_g3_i2.p1  ORF type:complete len:192 (+),score=34.61 TRINITY_DN10350_c0_g3_i2:125-700(+)